MSRGHGVREALIDVACNEAQLPGSQKALEILFRACERSKLLRNLLRTLIDDAESRGASMEKAGR